MRYDRYGRVQSAGALLSWVNRVCGVAVLAFLLLHIVETSFALYAPDLYDATMRLYRVPVFVVAEYLLVAAVVYHVLWGAFVMVVELQPRAVRRRKVAWTVLGAGYAVTLVAVGLVMFAPLVTG